MRNILEMQQKLVPDIMQVLQKRYDILRRIGVTGTGGRRTLAASLELTERTLRAELDLLRSQGLIEAGTTGVSLTERGRRLLEEMEPMVRELFGLSDLEAALRKRFGLKQAVVVPGDSDVSEEAKRELGRAGSKVLRRVIGPGDIVAVMGGTTMARMASQFSVPSPLRDNWFVPARGGLGESVDYQANTIASELAKRTGARYRMLHVPDHLSEDAYQTIMQEPNVREVVDMIRSARIVVHGIGDASAMARRRKLDAGTVQEILRDGALAEAFGYYFDREGAVVHRMATAGLRLEDIEAAESVIGIAGGRSKGEAIAAVMRFGHDDVLVTDEAAAEEALKHAGV
ncbi:sugar-binding transcriptional regulator [Cohnella hashimotonis]|uniref:Sugar-binding domain-containing protein n=1 Tax=Cohnella hashimotonis TaxID=2826895 RepID=A0ABT6TS92_9BACL|nr:sugar-binding domain-containing protein [Cohnella hashimotonis]MDI4648804.1 sugar-binding domain-containing protein [Cohnella hashimotonis]